jgi:ATP-binding protein involved in chromosome partitioning
MPGWSDPRFDRTTNVAWCARPEQESRRQRRVGALPGIMRKMPVRTIAIVSGKGGVGKTTVAIGLSLALSALGEAVGLLDADLYGPDVPRMLGLTRTSTASALTVWSDPQGRRRPRPVETQGIRVWSTQFLVAEDQAVALEAPMAGLLLRRAAGGVDWGELDWLVVDLPPGTADVQQHVAGELRLSGAVVVVTPQDVAHLDARKVLTMLARADVPVVGGVENMAPFPCPHCGAEIDLFPPTTSDRAIWASVPRLVSIPFDRGFAHGVDTPGLRQSFSGLARTLRAMLPPDR